MSTDVYFTVKRAGVAVTSIPSFAAQIDTMSVAEASYYNGASPYFLYNVYILQRIFDIRHEDLLVDLYNIDDKTGTYKQYRVVGDPEFFNDQHTEIHCSRVRGV